MYTLEELQFIASTCHRCPLHKARTNVIFGEGNPKAKMIFVGEGPGYYEDKIGRPFVGKAGQLLDKMMAAIEIQRKDVYITNIVKCRPPNNRNPLEHESNTCIEFLRWQVKIIDPKIIICLGAIAARNILHKDFRITKERGIWFDKGKYHTMATYHPAALLRDQSKKMNAWEDFKSIKERYNNYDRI